MSNFLGLMEKSLLSYALSCLKFDLADALVAAEATIPFIPSYMTYTDILNWFVANKQKMDLDCKDCNEKTVLDYAAGDSQLIKTLITNADIYPPDFAPICYVNYECQEEKVNSTIIEKQLGALELLLNFYNQGYEENEEGREFIVRLPQIMAGGLYEGKIVEVLEPLALSIGKTLFLLPSRNIKNNIILVKLALPYFSKVKIFSDQHYFKINFVIVY